jgi:membrane protein YqaA with SNARE-associated domain
MKNLLDQSYSWAEDWTRSRFGIWSLFILVFIDASLFPFPTTILIIAFSLFNHKRSMYNAIAATLAMGIGGMLGYAIGHYTWLTQEGDFTSVARFFFNHVPGFDVNRYNYISTLYNKWSYGIFFSAIFMPIPFQIYSITAGAFNVNFIIFAMTTFLFQGMRFFVLAYLCLKFGERVKVILQKNMKVVAAIISAILVFYILGVIFLKK